MQAQKNLKSRKSSNVGATMYRFFKKWRRGLLALKIYQSQKIEQHSTSHVPIFQKVAERAAFNAEFILASPRSSKLICSEFEIFENCFCRFFLANFFVEKTKPKTKQQ